MDAMLDQALTYLDQFDQSNGYFIHLNRDPIKNKGSNQNLNRKAILKLNERDTEIGTQNKDHFKGFGNQR